MANSILVSLGFKQTNDNLSKVLDSVNSLKLGVNDVVASTKGLNSEVEKFSKTMEQGRKFQSLQSIRAYSNGLKDIFSGIKSVVSSITDSFIKEFNFVESFAAMGDKVAKTSRLVGFSVKDYQAFGSAAQHAGMSTEDMDNALKRFNVELGKARSGDKTSLKMFDAILGGKKLSGFKDSVSLLEEVANGYTKLASAEQKAFVTQGLFGRGGFKMPELLSGGESGVKELISAFDNAGGGFSEKGAENAEKFNDSLQKMRETINSLKIKVAEDVFPTFIELFETVQKYVKENSNELIPKFKTLFLTISGTVKSILPKIPKILDFVTAISPKVVVIGGVIASVVPPLFSIVMGFATIAPLVAKIFAAIKIGMNYVWGIYAVVKLLVIAVGGALLLKIGAVIAGVVGLAIAIRSVIKNWNLVPDAIDWVLNTVKESVQWYANGIGSFFDGIGEGIRDFVMGGLDTIYGAVQKIKGFLSGLFGGFPDKVKSFFGIQDSINSNNQSSIQTLGASAAQAVQESRTTVTNRFAVDFKNMPRGVVVTPPDNGDFDWSRGYVLGGV